jgi:hypothetical protein
MISHKILIFICLFDILSHGPLMKNTLKETYLFNLIRRGTHWVRSRKADTTSLLRVLFYELPLKLVKKATRRVAAFLNLLLIANPHTCSRFEQFQDRHRKRLNHHYYIIILPNTLHIVAACLQCIPDHVDIILVTNGTKKWENRYIATHFHTYPTLNLPTVPGSSHEHGRVLNLLLKHNRHNFGIIDYDLFVFDPEFFNNFELAKNELLIGAFKLQNKKTGLEFPTTHFMFFNVALVQSLMEKYAIGAQEYRGIPRRLRNKLAKVGFGYDNFLKSYLRTFDTLNLLMAMAMAENKHIRFKTPASYFHLARTGGGGTGNPFIAYTDLKLLEHSRDEALKAAYLPLFHPLESSREALLKLPERSRSFAELKTEMIIQKTRRNQS